MTTFAQYLEAVDVAMRERRGLRTGQTFFDVLREIAYHELDVSDVQVRPCG